MLLLARWIKNARRRKEEEDEEGEEVNLPPNQSAPSLDPNAPIPAPPMPTPSPASAFMPASIQLPSAPLPPPAPRTATAPASAFMPATAIPSPFTPVAPAPKQEPTPVAAPEKIPLHESLDIYEFDPRVKINEKGEIIHVTIGDEGYDVHDWLMPDTEKPGELKHPHEEKFITLDAHGEILFKDMNGTKTNTLIGSYNVGQIK